MTDPRSDRIHHRHFPLRAKRPKAWVTNAARFRWLVLEDALVDQVVSPARTRVEDGVMDPLRAQLKEAM